MDDLVQWFGEQLDKDGARARDVAEKYGAAWVVNERMQAVQSDTGADVLDEPGGAPLAYIAEWGPARVLREIDAKREVLALHRPVSRRSTGSGGGTVEDCSVCGHFPAQFPCLTLRLLAVPHADRPGYRDDWRP